MRTPLILLLALAAWSTARAEPNWCLLEKRPIAAQECVDAVRDKTTKMCDLMRAEWAAIGKVSASAASGCSGFLELARDCFDQETEMGIFVEYAARNACGEKVGEFPDFLRERRKRQQPPAAKR